MRFAIGYPTATPDTEPFVSLVRDHARDLAEVYFPWVGAASGRAALGSGRDGAVDWTAQARLSEDLRSLDGLGVGLDLLLNANCYGGRAVSTHLENEVRSIIDHLGEEVAAPSVVTTMSLTIARAVKRHFPDIKVRCSVNMQVGTVEAMGYVAGLFDGYNLRYDVNRDLAHVQRVSRWCDEHGKELRIWANVGCLRNCPGHIFDGNTVAHDEEIARQVNVPDWAHHVCSHVYRDRTNRPAVLQGAWIRPEDLHHYEGLVPVVKLATRVHPDPRRVLEAYLERRYEGNLLDLLEPAMGPFFDPYVIDNRRFPDDWFERTSSCGGDCVDCDYCASVLTQVMTVPDEGRT